MSKLIYLAQPLDQARTTQAARLIADVLAYQLNCDGYGVYRPGAAFNFGDNPAPDPRVEVINRAALDECDVLVAVVLAGLASVGVPREIEAFAQAGKPWAALTDLTSSFSLVDASFTSTPDEQGCEAVVSWINSLPAADHDGVMTLLFAKDGQYDGQLPTRAYPDDAGYDLYAAEDVIIPYGQFRDVPCGVRVAMPPGTWGRIVGRSSTLRKRNLLVSEGVIDNGWRGPLFAGVRNLGEGPARVEKGDRIAQLILAPNLATYFRPGWASAEQFAAVPHDGRGTNGFGSSGT